MQKHYKLITGLLACVLGTGLEAMAPAQTTTSAAAVDLRRTARNCVVAPRDLASELLGSRACANQSASLASARQRINWRTVKKLSETLAEVNAATLGAEDAAIGGIAAAGQAAKGLGVGATSEPIVTHGFTWLDLRWNEYPKSEIDPLEFCQRISEKISSGRLLNMDLLWDGVFIDNLDFSNIINPVENDICYYLSPTLKHYIYFEFTENEWRMVTSFLQTYSGENKSFVECQNFVANNLPNALIDFLDPSQGPARKETFYVKPDGSVYFQIIAPCFSGDNGHVATSMALPMPDLKAIDIDPIKHNCKIVFEPNPQ